MNVYITYDRYEHNEWFAIYHIDTNKQRAIKHCKEIDLIDFISYGPDDCHSFQLQKVVMTPAEYKNLCRLAEAKSDEGDELHYIMATIFDKCDWNHKDCLLCSDGCSDVYDVIRYYCYKNGLDYNDDDVQSDTQDLLFNDDKLFLATLREYINIYY